ncbi:hypothetical protein GE061_003929 [Apolygus lucorum]|uniref:C2H2-type domain-containing protein n=1 Tax=Apolygus lucorum TaxID=248454 RepID=A0A8S9WZJ2_APOLU|nr:hypothetical protein GE061_003929 [Apolygus lucorum]
MERDKQLVSGASRVVQSAVAGNPFWEAGAAGDVQLQQSSGILLQAALQQEDSLSLGLQVLGILWVVSAGEKSRRRVWSTDERNARAHWLGDIRHGYRSGRREISSDNIADHYGLASLGVYHPNFAAIQVDRRGNSPKQVQPKTASISELKAHLRNHAGDVDKPYVCHLCYFRTAHPSALKMHIRTHTCEKPHNCTICDYSTARLGDLKKHLRIHTGEKPYACDVCDYRAGVLSNLKDHARTHTGEKKHGCNLCAYRAYRITDLKTHMKIHTGEKPYICHICNYRAVRLGHLKSHMKNLHTDKCT